MKRQHYISPEIEVVCLDAPPLLAASMMGGTAADYGDGFNMLDNATEMGGAASGYGGGSNMIDNATETGGAAGGYGGGSSMFGD